MEIRYAITETVYKIESYSRKAYGIAAVVLEDGLLKVLDSVEDLCEEAEPVQRLVKQCDMLRPDPIHLRNLVDDFLVGR